MNRAPTGKLPFLVRLQRVECLLYQFSSQIFFFCHWQIRISCYVDDSCPQDDAI